MRVITFSRFFPKKHPKAGQPTHFVEKVWKSIWDDHSTIRNPLYPWWQVYDKAFPVTGDSSENIHQHKPKHHTIRAGNRWKAGDMASLRVWSDKPYNSKQVEFAQVEVVKTWDIEIKVLNWCVIIKINGQEILEENNEPIADNDGLEYLDFVHWFALDQKDGSVFTGQVICWSETIDYTPQPEANGTQS